MEAVACAVTFGTVIAQLGVATIKLKNLWDEIAGVPEKIKELLEEMELFRMLFAEMETSIMNPAYPNLPLSFWTGHLMQLSLNRAKRAVTALETVTRELDDRLKTKRNDLKRTMVAIRGLMNKEKIQSLENRLKKAVKLLWMSYDLSSRHLQEERLRRHVTQTIRAEMAITLTLQQPESLQLQPSLNSNEPPDNYKHRPTARHLAKAQTRAILRWRLPSWWSTTVWEVCSAPQPGWNYGLRVYSLVPDDSLIMQSIRNNDAEAVTELFRSRRASPFDRDMGNHSLLTRAFMYHVDPELSVIKTLLDWSPSEFITEQSESFASPLDLATYNVLRMPNTPLVSRQILQLLWSLNHDVDDLGLLPLSFITMLDTRPPIYHDNSIPQKCHSIRIEVCWPGRTKDIDSSWISADGKVQPLHVDTSIAQGKSLVHSAALKVAAEVAYRTSSDCDGLCDDKFTQDIINASTPESLHHLEDNNYPRRLIENEKGRIMATPLLCLISPLRRALAMQGSARMPFSMVASFSSLNGLHHAMKRALHIWVRNLRCAGVDLTAYGHKERSLLHGNEGRFRGVYDSDSSAENLQWFIDSFVMQPLPLWIIDLTYGVEPEDWDLNFVVEFEAMARDFWELIEEQAFTGMPGSWVE